MEINQKLLHRAADESIREVRWGNTWLKHRRYVVKSRGSDVLLEVEARREYCRYSPLSDPQLFVAFARQPEPVTEDVMLGWAHKYGALGLRDVFVTHEAAESLVRFREEVRTARRVLRLYELATSERANAAEIAGVLGPLEDTEIGIDVWPNRLRRANRADAVRIALGEVELVVRQKLRKHTYAYVYVLASGVFEPALGFHDLLGAIYLQARALLTSSGIRRCQAPDCVNIIPPGSYRNKIYCDPPEKNTCAQRAHDHRKRAEREAAVQRGR